MWPGNQFQAPLNSPRILSKKDSDEVSMLIWTNFNSLAIKYLI